MLSEKGVPSAVVKVAMCSREGSASEVETHKNIDSVLHTKTTFQAHSVISVSIQKSIYDENGTRNCQYKTEVNWVTFIITSTGPQTASITNY